MDTLIYILKSTSILSLFFIVYFLVLRKDTFFSTNRHYLIGGIFTSLLLPFLVFSKTIFVEAPISNSTTLISSTGFSEPINTINSLAFGWLEIGVFIYLGGVIFMGLRFIKQLISLYYLLGKYPSYKQNGFRYIEVNDNTTPFSFFKYIVFNPALHTEDDLKMILKHEQTHASQLHSIDVILSNMILIMQWINPIVWLYKKSIEENLEFIADSETIEQVQSKKEYQLTLIKVLSPTINQHVLTNNFYQSLIKKRIIMLHKNASKTQNQWKLLLILPLLGVFLWSFNVEEDIKYTDHTSSEPSIEYTTDNHSIKEEIIIPVISENKKSNDSKITVTIDKNTSEAELDKLKTLFRNNYNITLKFNGVKRNSNGKIIKIKVTMKSENSNASYNLDDTDGIQEFIISYDSESGSISIGNNNNHDLHYSSKSDNHFVYDIDEDNHGNGKTWVIKDGHKVKKGKHEYIIHENNEDEDGHEEIHIISGSGNNSNVWVTKDGNHIKKGEHTVIIETKGDDDGEGNIFFIKSGDDDDESIFIHKEDDNGFFFVGNDRKDPLVFINGEKSSKEAMEKLGSDAIETIEIIKGDKATEEYGKDAKDGVILIKTKKE